MWTAVSLPPSCTSVGASRGHLLPLLDHNPPHDGLKSAHLSQDENPSYSEKLHRSYSSTSKTSSHMLQVSLFRVLPRNSNLRRERPGCWLPSEALLGAHGYLGLRWMKGVWSSHLNHFTHSDQSLHCTRGIHWPSASMEPYNPLQSSVRRLCCSTLIGSLFLDKN